MSNTEHAQLPKPYYQDGAVTIYNSDCRKIIPSLERFDLLLTDPPYGLGEKLHGGSWGTKGTNWDDARPESLIFMGLAKKYCIWGGNYFNLPISRGWLVWYKPDANGYLSNVELAWTSLDMTIKYMSYSIAATNPERNGHPTLKPLKIMLWCLSYFPDCNTILDPFMGSGTTLRAAKDLGRKAIGIEIEEKYCEIAAKRMAQEVMEL
jgi:DNA modification methylase